MKKIPDINRLWNVCGQMEVGALLTWGSGIKIFLLSYQENYPWVPIQTHSLATESLTGYNFLLPHLKRHKYEECNNGSATEWAWTENPSLKAPESNHLSHLQLDGSRWKENTKIWTSAQRQPSSGGLVADLVVLHFAQGSLSFVFFERPDEFSSVSISTLKSWPYALTEDKSSDKSLGYASAFNTLGFIPS